MALGRLVLDGDAPTSHGSRCKNDRVTTLDELVELERLVWQALLDGDGELDTRLLSPDFLGVYPTGFARREDHVEQLSGGPVVAWFELFEARVITVADDAALLVYRADFARPTMTEISTMYVSSLWCRRNGRWVNTFSQDTPAAPPD